MIRQLLMATSLGASVFSFVLLSARSEVVERLATGRDAKIPEAIGDDVYSREPGRDNSGSSFEKSYGLPEHLYFPDFAAAR